ncbi:hypothetical protein [Fulvivirga lutimaris]|uniref:hypothetical protein n=1 Tax=Fulvivirga lutimaris TaxID=1819566 RepID=UPI0012BC8E97|nr:hypothetical protein [Fulvivirga lutimaris]MTI40775.1 hypothetical protein [Fulvivirga lutimaris]
MNKVLPVVLFFALLISCESKKSNENKEVNESMPTISEQLIGKWHNLEIKVVIKKDDGDSVAYVPQDKWEEILNIKPIVTAFNTDSTFVSEYMSLEGEVIMTSAGTWVMEGDSLIMTERGSDNTYLATIKNDTVSFTGYIDWDQDGAMDDLYSGTQIRH